MKIVGIVILVLIVLVVGGVLLARWLLRRALKRVMGTLADALIEAMRGSALCAPPPPRVHLVPATDSPWDHETQAEESAGGLRTLGFEPGGVYEIAEVYGITLQVFTLTEERVYAVLYDHVQQGVWVDFVIRHEDDGVLTVSNVPLHDAVAPPWSRLVQDTEASLPELYQRLLSEAEDRPRRRVSAEDFPATFERSHAREMDWRNLRGGPTEEEIRRIAAGTGEEVTDDVVAATREQQAAAAAEGVSVLLKERFQAANPMPDDQAERLFLVHDRLTRDAVCSALSEALEDADVSGLYSEDDPEADFDELLEARFEAVPETIVSTREAFGQVNDALPAGCRLEKVGELTEPVAADVYLAPPAPGPGTEEPE